MDTHEQRVDLHLSFVDLHLSIVGVGLKPFEAQFSFSEIARS